MTTLIIVVGVSMLTSATCSLMEAVLYAVPVSHVEHLAEKSRAGRILRDLRREVDRPIAAILSLNTLANTAGAALAGAVASNVLGPTKVVWFSVAFTLGILIFSEVVPKTAGVNFSRQLAAPLAWPLQILVWTMAPIVWVCMIATKVVAKRDKTSDGVSPEELITMARLGQLHGSIDPHEATVITNILSLADKPVSSLTISADQVFSQDATSRIGDLETEVSRWPHSRVPVWRDTPNNIVGIVQRREVMAAILANKNDLLLQSLIRSAPRIRNDEPAEALLRRFLDKHEHIAVVEDNAGDFIGIVSLEDVLEEILGREIVG